MKINRVITLGLTLCILCFANIKFSEAAASATPKIDAKQSSASIIIKNDSTWEIHTLIGTLRCDGKAISVLAGQVGDQIFIGIKPNDKRELTAPDGLKGKCSFEYLANAMKGEQYSSLQGSVTALGGRINLIFLENQWEAEKY